MDIDILKARMRYLRDLFNVRVVIDSTDEEMDLARRRAVRSNAGGCFLPESSEVHLFVRDLERLTPQSMDVSVLYYLVATKGLEDALGPMLWDRLCLEVGRRAVPALHADRPSVNPNEARRCGAEFIGALSEASSAWQTVSDVLCSLTGLSGEVSRSLCAAQTTYWKVLEKEARLRDDVGLLGECLKTKALRYSINGTRGLCDLGRLPDLYGCVELQGRSLSASVKILADGLSACGLDLSEVATADLIREIRNPLAVLKQKDGNGYEILTGIGDGRGGYLCIPMYDDGKGQSIKAGRIYGKTPWQIISTCAHEDRIAYLRPVAGRRNAFEMEGVLDAFRKMDVYGLGIKGDAASLPEHSPVRCSQRLNSAANIVIKHRNANRDKEIYTLFGINRAEHEKFDFHAALSRLEDAEARERAAKVASAAVPQQPALRSMKEKLSEPLKRGGFTQKALAAFERSGLRCAGDLLAYTPEMLAKIGGARAARDAERYIMSLGIKARPSTVPAAAEKSMAEGLSEMLASRTGVLRTGTVPMPCNADGRYIGGSSALSLTAALAANGVRWEGCSMFLTSEEASNRGLEIEGDAVPCRIRTKGGETTVYNVADTSLRRQHPEAFARIVTESLRCPAPAYYIALLGSLKGSDAATLEKYFNYMDSRPATVPEIPEPAPLFAVLAETPDLRVGRAVRPDREDSVSRAVGDPAALNEAVTAFLGGAAPVSSSDTLEVDLRNAGATDEECRSVLDAVRTGVPVNAVTLGNGNILVLSDNMGSEEQVRLTYIHERTHSYLVDNPALMDALAQEIEPGTERSLLLSLLPDKDTISFYEGKDRKAILEEAVCFAMEKALSVKSDELSRTLSRAGVVSLAFIDFMKREDARMRALLPADPFRREPDLTPDVLMDIWAGPGGSHRELSNMAARPFEIDGRRFTCVEQCFQYGKAQLAGDEEAIGKILAAGDGFEAKSLGSRVRGLDVARWDAVKEGVMKEAMRASFGQNPDAAAALLATGDATLTHRKDPRWSEAFPRLLMEVRMEMKHGYDIVEQKATGIYLALRHNPEDGRMWADIVDSRGASVTGFTPEERATRHLVADENGMLALHAHTSLEAVGPDGEPYVKTVSGEEHIGFRPDYEALAAGGTVMSQVLREMDVDSAVVNAWNARALFDDEKGKAPQETETRPDGVTVSTYAPMLSGRSHVVERRPDGTMLRQYCLKDGKPRGYAMDCREDGSLERLTQYGEDSEGRQLRSSALIFSRSGGVDALETLKIYGSGDEGDYDMSYARLRERIESLMKVRMMAPNGQPSRLTRELYDYVRTPEFIARYGDWMHGRAHTPLDVNGEPLVLWHGSTASFDRFDLSHAGDNTGLVEYTDRRTGEKILSDSDRALFFTSERNAAISYAFLAKTQECGRVERDLRDIASLVRTGGKASYTDRIKTRKQLVEEVEFLRSRGDAYIDEALKGIDMNAERPVGSIPEGLREGYAEKLQRAASVYSGRYRMNDRGGLSNQLNNISGQMEYLDYFRENIGRLCANDPTVMTEYGEDFNHYNQSFFSPEGRFVVSVHFEDGRMKVYGFRDEPVYMDAMTEEERKEFVGRIVSDLRACVESYNRSLAESGYGSAVHLYPVFLRTENPLEHDYRGSAFPDKYKANEKYDTAYIAARQVQKALRDGNDAVVYRNVRDPFMMDTYGVFSADRIEMLDPERFGLRWDVTPDLYMAPEREEEDAVEEQAQPEAMEVSRTEAVSSRPVEVTFSDGYRKGEPQASPDTAFLFTENAEAADYVRLLRGGSDVRYTEGYGTFDYPHKAFPKINVSDMGGRNSAGIRTGADGTPTPNAFGIVVKKYQQDAGGRFVSQEGCFGDTDAEFEQFRRMNERVFRDVEKMSPARIVLPRQMGLGKAALPLRFCEWLGGELASRYGVESEVKRNLTAGYEGYGLEILGLKPMEEINKENNTMELEKTVDEALAGFRSDFETGFITEEEMNGKAVDFITEALGGHATAEQLKQALLRNGYRTAWEALAGHDEAVQDLNSEKDAGYKSHVLETAFGNEKSNQGEAVSMNVDQDIQFDSKVQGSDQLELIHGKDNLVSSLKDALLGKGVNRLVFGASLLGAGLSPEEVDTLKNEAVNAALEAESERFRDEEYPEVARNTERQALELRAAVLTGPEYLEQSRVAMMFSKGEQEKFPKEMRSFGKGVFKVVSKSGAEFLVGRDGTLLVRDILGQTEPYVGEDGIVRATIWRNERDERVYFDAETGEMPDTVKRPMVERLAEEIVGGYDLLTHEELNEYLLGLSSTDIFVFHEEVERRVLEQYRRLPGRAKDTRHEMIAEVNSWVLPVQTARMQMQNDGIRTFEATDDVDRVNRYCAFVGEADVTGVLATKDRYVDVPMKLRDARVMREEGIFPRSPEERASGSMPKESAKVSEMMRTVRDAYKNGAPLSDLLTGDGPYRRSVSGPEVFEEFRRFLLFAKGHPKTDYVLSLDIEPGRFSQSGYMGYEYAFLMKEAMKDVYGDEIPQNVVIPRSWLKTGFFSSRAEGMQEAQPLEKLVEPEVEPKQPKLRKGLFFDLSRRLRSEERTLVMQMMSMFTGYGDEERIRLGSPVRIHAKGKDLTVTECLRRGHDYKYVVIPDETAERMDEGEETVLDLTDLNTEDMKDILEEVERMRKTAMESTEARMQAMGIIRDWAENGTSGMLPYLTIMDGSGNEYILKGLHMEDGGIVWEFSTDGSDDPEMMDELTEAYLTEYSVGILRSMALPVLEAEEKEVTEGEDPSVRFRLPGGYSVRETPEGLNVICDREGVPIHDGALMTTKLEHGVFSGRIENGDGSVQPFIFYGNTGEFFIAGKKQEIARPVDLMTFTESSSEGYATRTRENAEGADLTVAFAVDYSTGGETMTAYYAGCKDPAYLGKRGIPKGDDRYVHCNWNKSAREMAQDIKEGLRRLGKDTEPVTLNIAGNGIYTFAKSGISQEDVDAKIYEVLSALHDYGVTLKGVRSGGQTGADEAGAKAGIMLGVPTEVHAPKGYVFRGANGKDVTGEAEFKQRFGDVLGIVYGRKASDTRSVSSTRAERNPVVFQQNLTGSLTAVENIAATDHTLVICVGEPGEEDRRVLSMAGDKGRLLRLDADLLRARKVTRYDLETLISQLRESGIKEDGGRFFITGSSAEAIDATGVDRQYLQRVVDSLLWFLNGSPDRSTGERTEPGRSIGEIRSSGSPKDMDSYAIHSACRLGVPATVFADKGFPTPSGLSGYRYYRDEYAELLPQRPAVTEDDDLEEGQTAELVRSAAEKKVMGLTVSAGKSATRDQAYFDVGAERFKALHMDSLAFLPGTRVSINGREFTTQWNVSVREAVLMMLGLEPENDIYANRSRILSLPKPESPLFEPSMMEVGEDGRTKLKASVAEYEDYLLENAIYPMYAACAAQHEEMFKDLKTFMSTEAHSFDTEDAVIVEHGGVNARLIAGVLSGVPAGAADPETGEVRIDIQAAYEKPAEANGEKVEESRRPVLDFSAPMTLAVTGMYKRGAEDIKRYIAEGTDLVVKIGRNRGGQKGFISKSAFENAMKECGVSDVLFLGMDPGTDEYERQVGSLMEDFRAGRRVQFVVNSSNPADAYETYHLFQDLARRGVNVQWISDVRGETVVASQQKVIENTLFPRVLIQGSAEDIRFDKNNAVIPSDDIIIEMPASYKNGVKEIVGKNNFGTEFDIRPGRSTNMQQNCVDIASGTDIMISFGGENARKLQGSKGRLSGKVLDFKEIVGSELNLERLTDPDYARRCAEKFVDRIMESVVVASYKDESFDPMKMTVGFTGMTGAEIATKPFYRKSASEEELQKEGADVSKGNVDVADELVGITAENARQDYGLRFRNESDRGQSYGQAFSQDEFSDVPNADFSTEDDRTPLLEFMRNFITFINDPETSARVSASKERKNITEHDASFDVEGAEKSKALFHITGWVTDGDNGLNVESANAAASLGLECRLQPTKDFKITRIDGRVFGSRNHGRPVPGIESMYRNRLHMGLRNTVTEADLMKAAKESLDLYMKEKEAGELGLSDRQLYALHFAGLQDGDISILDKLLEGQEVPDWETLSRNVKSYIGSDPEYDSLVEKEAKARKNMESQAAYIKKYGESRQRIVDAMSAEFNKRGSVQPEDLQAFVSAVKERLGGKMPGRLEKLVMEKYGKHEFSPEQGEKALAEFEGHMSQSLDRYESALKSAVENLELYQGPALMFSPSQLETAGRLADRDVREHAERGESFCTFKRGNYPDMWRTPRMNYFEEHRLTVARNEDGSLSASTSRLLTNDLNPSEAEGVVDHVGEGQDVDIRMASAVLDTNPLFIYHQGPVEKLGGAAVSVIDHSGDAKDVALAKNVLGPQLRASDITPVIAVAEPYVRGRSYARSATNALAADMLDNGSSAVLFSNGDEQDETVKDLLKRNVEQGGLNVHEAGSVRPRGDSEEKRMWSRKAAVTSTKVGTLLNSTGIPYLGAIPDLMAICFCFTAAVLPEKNGKGKAVKNSDGDTKENKVHEFAPNADGIKAALEKAGEILNTASENEPEEEAKEVVRPNYDVVRVLRYEDKIHMFVDGRHENVMEKVSEMFGATAIIHDEAQDPDAYKRVREELLRRTQTQKNPVDDSVEKFFVGRPGYSGAGAEELIHPVGEERLFYVKGRLYDLTNVPEMPMGFGYDVADMSVRRETLPAFDSLCDTVEQAWEEVKRDPAVGISCDVHTSALHPVINRVSRELMIMEGDTVRLKVWIDHRGNLLINEGSPLVNDAGDKEGHAVFSERIVNISGADMRDVNLYDRKEGALKVTEVRNIGQQISLALKGYSAVERKNYAVMEQWQKDELLKQKTEGRLNNVREDNISILCEDLDRGGLLKAGTGFDRATAYVYASHAYMRASKEVDAAEKAARKAQVALAEAEKALYDSPADKIEEMDRRKVAYDMAGDELANAVDAWRAAVQRKCEVSDSREKICRAGSVTLAQGVDTPKGSVTLSLDNVPLTLVKGKCSDEDREKAQKIVDKKMAEWERIKAGEKRHLIIRDDMESPNQVKLSEADRQALDDTVKRIEAIRKYLAENEGKLQPEAVSKAMEDLSRLQAKADSIHASMAVAGPLEERRLDIYAEGTIKLADNLYQVKSGDGYVLSDIKGNALSEEVKYLKPVGTGFWFVRYADDKVNIINAGGEALSPVKLDEIYPVLGETKQNQNIIKVKHDGLYNLLDLTTGKFALTDPETGVARGVETMSKVIGNWVYVDAMERDGEQAFRHDADGNLILVRVDDKGAYVRDSEGKYILAKEGEASKPVPMKRMVNVYGESVTKTWLTEASFYRKDDGTVAAKFVTERGTKGEFNPVEMVHLRRDQISIELNESLDKSKGIKFNPNGN